jgi:WD40 repeat protein
MVAQLPDGVRLLRTLMTGHEGPIGRIAWSPDGRLLATPSLDRTTRIWDSESGACLHTICGHHDAVAVAFDPDGGVLATVGDYTKLWNVDSGALHTALDIVGCTGAVFSPDNRILVTAGDYVTLWTVDRCGFTPTYRCSRFCDLCGSGRQALGGIGPIVLWEVPTGESSNPCWPLR